MVARLPIEERQPEELFLEKLPAPTQQAFRYAASHELVSAQQWYLAGGTALALQVGHRESVDLDFFSQTDFDESQLEQHLLNTTGWTSTLRERGTLYGELEGARVSFIAYPHFRPAKQHLRCGAIRLLLPPDIAAMKIIAISQRGRKRDFIDLYWYCQNREELAMVLERALEQYPQRHNVPHLLKSLIYFTDAEDDPMPVLHFQAKWNDVKKYFEKQVPRLARKLVGFGGEDS